MDEARLSLGDRNRGSLALGPVQDGVDQVPPDFRETLGKPAKVSYRQSSSALHSHFNLFHPPSDIPEGCPDVFPL